MGRFHKAGAGIDHLERLGSGDSLVHGLHPAAKGIVTLLFIGTVVSVPPGNPGILGPFVFYPVFIAAVSGIPWKPLFARLVPVLPFALFFGLSNLFLMREAVFTLNGAITVTQGMIFFYTLLLKTALTVFAALLLVATTPFSAIASCITTPPPLRLIGLQMLLTMRYLAVLLEEAEAMWTAYLLRSPQSKAVKMRDMGAFMGQLLLRSFDRAERVFCAMKCRGFDGVYRESSRKRFFFRTDGTFTAANLVYIALGTTVFLALRLMNVGELWVKGFL